MMRAVGIFVAFLSLAVFAGDGFLGVNLELVQNTGEDTKGNGVYISKVMKGFAADEAGLQARDQIIGIGEARVTDYQSLKKAMADYSAGDRVNVTVLRNDEEMVAEVVMGEKPESTRKWAFEFSNERPFLGVDTEKLSEQLAAYFKVDHGLLITEVEKDSPAEKAGLKAGDIITAVDGEQIIKSNDLLEAILAKNENDVISVAISREGKAKKLSATLGKTKGFAMNRFNFSPYVNLEGLKNLEEAEGLGGLKALENLPEIMGQLQLSIPELQFELKEAMGEDFAENLEAQMEELRKRLEELEEKKTQIKKKKELKKDDLR